MRTRSAFSWRYLAAIAIAALLGEAAGTATRVALHPPPGPAFAIALFIATAGTVVLVLDRLRANGTAAGCAAAFGSLWFLSYVRWL